MAVDTWKTLETKMLRPLKYSVEAYGRLIQEIIKKELLNRWYNTDANEYVRTYDVLNSITTSKVVKVPNGYALSVYFDKDKIRAERVDGSCWGQHISFNNDITWGGMTIGEWIPVWIDKGQNSDVYSFDGIEYVKTTMAEIQKSGKKIESEIKKLGYDIFVF